MNVTTSTQWPVVVSLLNLKLFVSQNASTDILKSWNTSLKNNNKHQIFRWCFLKFHFIFAARRKKNKSFLCRGKRWTGQSGFCQQMMKGFLSASGWICSAVLTLDFTELLCFWSWEIIIRGTAGRVNQRRTFWSEVTAWWDLVQRGGSSRGSSFFLLTVKFDVLEICATPLAPQTLLLQHPCCIIRTIPPSCWSEDYAITVWPHVFNF